MEGYRHGDMALIKIDSLPEGLKESKTKVLMTGSGGNDHTFAGGHFYLKNVSSIVFGYLVADETKLLHRDHGVKKVNSKLKEASIADGIYELRRQAEDTHEGMKVVED